MCVCVCVCVIDSLTFSYGFLVDFWFGFPSGQSHRRNTPLLGSNKERERDRCTGRKLPRYFQFQANLSWKTRIFLNFITS